MTDRSTIPARRRRARIMRLVNVPMRVLLSLPFPTPLGTRLMLVNYTGRRSGKAYRQPVSYVRHEDVLLTPGGGKWKLNLSPDVQVRVRLRGRDVTARAELVGDVDEVERLLATMAAINPTVYRFVAIPREPDGRLNRPALETAIGYGFRIVRWHLDEADRPA